MNNSTLFKQREEKQQLVRQEILLQGYDPADFTIFMAEKKYNGTDVDAWTYSQLLYVIISQRIDYYIADTRVQNIHEAFFRRQADPKDRCINLKGLATEKLSCGGSIERASSGGGPFIELLSKEKSIQSELRAATTDWDQYRLIDSGIKCGGRRCNTSDRQLLVTSDYKDQPVSDDNSPLIQSELHTSHDHQNNDIDQRRCNRSSQGLIPNHSTTPVPLEGGQVWQWLSENTEVHNIGLPTDCPPALTSHEGRYWV